MNNRIGIFRLENYMQPLKLRTRHMPTKVTKPPKKGKGAKYDRRKQKDWKKNESVKLSPIVEVILKIHRVRLLVERLLLEGSLGGWRGNFVVGPDGKIIGLDGATQYHGHALHDYPGYAVKAAKFFGGLDELDAAIGAGSQDLYDLMGEWGFIRAGRSNAKPWISLNPKKTPEKSLMTILRLARENKIERFDVEDITNNRYESDVTVDEFIERFL